MTQNEMLAGLHGLARWLDKHDFKPSGDIVRAAITALEAAPAQVEAPPSDESEFWADMRMAARVGEWIEKDEQVEARPSEAAMERAERWRDATLGSAFSGPVRVAIAASLAAEFDQHAEALIEDADICLMLKDKAVEDCNRLRAELEQARGDVVRLQNELASHRQR